MDIIMLCGAGGAGKSTVASILGTMPDHWPMMSSSRSTYARLGIPTETAAFDMDVKTQQMLQDEIMIDHLAKIKETIGSGYERFDGGDFTLVIDRSPLDHLSYWTRTNVLPGDVTTEAFHANLRHIQRFFGEFNVNKIGWFDFPFPTPWDTEDGQRDQNKIKTLEMSLMTTGMVSRYHAFIPANKNFYHRMTLQSPRERAHTIIEQMAVDL